MIARYDVLVAGPLKQLHSDWEAQKPEQQAAGRCILVQFFVDGSVEVGSQSAFKFKFLASFWGWVWLRLELSQIKVDWAGLITFHHQVSWWFEVREVSHILVNQQFCKPKHKQRRPMSVYDASVGTALTPQTQILSIYWSNFLEMTRSLLLVLLDQSV